MAPDRPQSRRDYTGRGGGALVRAPILAGMALRPWSGSLEVRPWSVDLIALPPALPTCCPHGR